MNKEEYKGRLAFCGWSSRDVLKAVQGLGIPCDEARLSHAIAGDRAPALDRIRQKADEVTMCAVREKKADVERQIGAGLACLGIPGRVNIRVPSENEIPVYLDGELFGLYDVRRNRLL